MESFYKHNSSNFNDSLIKEVEGLNLLDNILKNSENKYIKIPEIISVNDEELVLEKIEIDTCTKELSRNFAIGLALLHRNYSDKYGFEDDNYIGLSKQKNCLSSNWGEFFVENRLEYQVSLIKDKVIKDRFQVTLDTHKTQLISFLNSNCEKASIVHGDLWSGNVLFSDSMSYLIDPSVYYADREVDIAMTRMFSGFDEEFYKYYDKTYPLSKEYNSKEIIYNLYHYLNHYNLFGSAYLNSCIEGFTFIKKF